MFLSEFSITSTEQQAFVLGGPHVVTPHAAIRLTILMLLDSVFRTTRTFTMIRTFCILAYASIVSVESFVIRCGVGSQQPPQHAFRTKTTSLNAFDIAGTASAVDAFYHSQPYAAAFMTCSFKASAADLVVQSQTDEQEQAEENSRRAGIVDFDIQRNVGFLLYGGIYQGCVQEYLYNHVFPSVFGDSHSWLAVVEQVALDMVVLTPFMCLPVAYAIKAFLSADDSVLDGLRKYVSHVQNEGLLLRYWSIWAPVQFLTFGFVPSHLRIPFIAFVSFFWLMILSNISSQDTQPTKQ